jgi:hypothetical protein
MDYSTWEPSSAHYGITKDEVIDLQNEARDEGVDLRKLIHGAAFIFEDCYDDGFEEF